MSLSPANQGRRRVVASAVLFVLVLLAPALGEGGSTAPTDSREYQIKAAFLFNFVQFVDWPGSAFTAPDAPLCIGVIGDDPFGSALDDVVAGESVDGRKLVVRRSRSLDSVESCQLLFVSRSERADYGAILERLDEKPILTVSEIDGFARQGGVIGLFLDDQRVRFEINPVAARKRGLRISSELLRLGRVVATRGAS